MFKCSYFPIVVLRVSESKQHKCIWKFWVRHPAYRRISNNYFKIFFLTFFAAEPGIAVEIQSASLSYWKVRVKLVPLGSSNSNPALGPYLCLIKQLEEEGRWARSWRGSNLSVLLFDSFHTAGDSQEKTETAWVSTHISTFVKSSLISSYCWETGEDFLGLFTFCSFQG